MRTLTDHITQGDSVNHQLEIQVIDEPGAGGANHDYVINIGPDATFENGRTLCRFLFQNGPIKEAGVNGVTHEALLAIIIDRLKSFQAGPYACDENHQALSAAQNCLDILKTRTRKRMERGVEGTHEK